MKAGDKVLIEVTIVQHQPLDDNDYSYEVEAHDGSTFWMKEEQLISPDVQTPCGETLARLVVTDAMVEAAFWAHHRVPPKYQRNALRAAIEAAFAMVKGDGNAT